MKYTGKTGTSDHLVLIKRDHRISLIIIHLRRSISFALGGQSNRFVQYTNNNNENSDFDNIKKVRFA